MDQFLTWLATSPYATGLKAGIAAALAYLLANIDTLNLPPIAYVAFVAALPMIINALNPKYTRQGIGKVK